MEKSKEVTQIDTVLSLFRRKSRGKSLRKTRVATFDPAANLFPDPAMVPAVARSGSRRRRRRSASYTSGCQRLPMFRVT